MSKTYPPRHGTRAILGRGGIFSAFGRRKTPPIPALKDITLTVEPGESLGIIGRNGSGKSTLLKILAGVTLPTTGEVTVRGRVASLLELGAGFHPMLSGRENVYLNAGLMGMRHAQVDCVFDRIVDFSGIGEFIDQPVETYSSGMYVRLAFAVAVHVNPDVFLVDEVLSVGDEEFQRRCRTKIGELQEQGKTIVFVSHDLGSVSTLCERIVLLSEGRMIVRETAQKTINFYLRQVGRGQGVHTFSEGEMEGIHCEGRVSLFWRGEEVTAASGFWMQLTSLGQVHTSRDAADWELVERDETGCRARGRMSRLPLCLDWRLRLADGTLKMDLSMECEHDVDLTSIEGVFPLPTSYRRWLYGDYSGPFPDIQASDDHWVVLVAPELGARGAAALASDTSALPPLVFRLTAHNRHFNMTWANSQYALNSRLLAIQAVFPEGDCTFTGGRHALFSLEVDTDADAAEVERRIRAEHTLHAGRLAARFDRGMVRLSVDGEELSAFLHVYSSMLVEQLWVDSLSLQWTGLDCDGQRLRTSGASRRFPFRQHWELEAVEDGIAVRIWIEVFEAFQAQEYHVSAVLRPEYERWRTDGEEGVFPPFDPLAERWQHLNKSYGVGTFATALSLSLPSVTIEVSGDGPPFRMTALNTKHKENARVLQALRPSDTGALHFEPGRHIYFSGVIRIGAARE